MGSTLFIFIFTTKKVRSELVNKKYLYAGHVMIFRLKSGQNLNWDQILIISICNEHEINILKVKDEKIHLLKYEGYFERFFLNKRQTLKYSQ